MRKFMLSLAALVLLVPMVGLAADVQNAEVVAKDTLVHNLYLAGQNPTVDANVTGDLVVAGGVVTVNGDVSGGVLAAGSTLNLNGTVGQSVRVAGGNINIDGTVGGDLVIFGGNVILGTKSVVTGDVMVFGGTLDLKGTVKGAVKDTYVGTVNLSGNVLGDATFTRVGMLTVTSDAVVGGALKYSSQNEGTIASAAKVAGKTEFTKVAANNKMNRWTPNVGSVIFGISMMFITILVFMMFLPKFTKEVVNNVLVNPWAKLGAGFVALIVAPVVMILLAITIFGLGVMGYLAMIYFALIALAGTVSAIFAGAYMWKLLRKESDYVLDWKTAAIGVLLVAVAKLIPVIGWLVALVLFLLVFGTLVTMSFDFVKAQRA